MRRDANGSWLHRSPYFPDLAEVMNGTAALDDATIEMARHVRDGIGFVGSPDYGRTSFAYWRERFARTPMRSGFGVRIPLAAAFLGLCRADRGYVEIPDLLLLQSVASAVALTLRSANGVAPE